MSNAEMSSNEGQRPEPPHEAGADLSRAEQIRLNTDGRHVCPYCGTVAESRGNHCAHCGMEDNPTTRQATRARLGPWYVLQAKNPAAPGMSFATLLALVRRGQITPTSVVRGPTTQQMWTFAAQVRGVSREFGVCFGCGEEVERSANLCPHCQRLQEPPVNVDVLVERKPADAAAARRAAMRPLPGGGPPPGTEAAAATDVGLGPETLANAFSRLPGGDGEAAETSSTTPPHQRILSPKDLAAAFALDVPKPGTAARSTEKATTAARERRRGGRRATWYSLAAVLALAVGAAAYLAYDPVARAQAEAGLARATEWTQAKAALVTDWIRGTDVVPDSRQTADRRAIPAAHREPRQQPAATRGVKEPAPAVRAKPDPAVPPTEVAAAVSPTIPAGTGAGGLGRRQSTTDPALEPAGQAPPAAPPAQARSQVTDSDSERAVQIGPPRARDGEIVRLPEPAAPRVVAPKPADPVTPPAAPAKRANPAAAPTTEDVSRSLDLFRRALDAESENDFASAVTLYEQIRELPEAAWPVNLDRRLDAARRRSGR